MPIPFAKYSGCGNDFILIDNRTAHFNHLRTIPLLCHRQKGIGADGLILLENSSSADYRMRIFNSDGSEAEMCGNGLRCLGRFLRDLGDPSQEFLIETMHHRLLVEANGELVSVQMPPPADFRFEALTVEGQEISLYVLNTGVPHAVFFVEDLDDPTLFLLAPKIRFHQEFAPKGTNVDFVKILSSCRIAIRTYERGVEGETLACGTGAAAAAIASTKAHKLESPIEVHVRSQDTLTISFSDPSHLESLRMQGPAIKVYQGETSLFD